MQVGLLPRVDTGEEKIDEERRGKTERPAGNAFGEKKTIFQTL
jgi:hypothetical protein